MVKKSTIPELTIGMEEELFLVDQNSLNCMPEMPRKLRQQFIEQYPDEIAFEYLASQIEIVTIPCSNIADLRKQFGVVTLAAANYVSVNSLAYIHVKDLDYVFQTDGKSQIYGYLQAVATPDYANTDALYIRLHIRTLGV